MRLLDYPVVNGVGGWAIGMKRFRVIHMEPFGSKTSSFVLFQTLQLGPDTLNTEHVRPWHFWPMCDL